ncbi:uncharacterized protein EI90DRAFT_3128323 [Cantharellus anzutake]|uniref:uncharacterized protein n=1 Tax=Cantharellus anzutake TaxID=1750568 RepID=UPI0019030B72|nr:uncharacterized protein EI90DRAFT_3128323 [Cantharellus anzutake]KAF8325786.1 hypothetical protein EI90DRAFT_3128323 [Cantharellus anzutake]
MQIFSPNVDSILLTVLLVVLPNIAPYVVHAVRQYRSQQEGDSPPRTQLQSPLLPFLGWILMLHSLHIIYQILFCYPTNLFNELNLAVVTSSSLLRQALLKGRPADSELPNSVEALLSRLQSLDARSLYVRFGHDTVEHCDYCHTFADFALFAFPSAAMTYVQTIALVGLMTVKGSGKRRWRSWGVGILVTAAVVEAWILTTVDIQFTSDNGKTVMWHDGAWLLRHSLFLLLPIGIQVLPYEYDSLVLLASLPASVQSFERTLNSLQALEHLQAASLRNEGTRPIVDRYWEEQARLARAVRGNEEVKEEATRVGIGFGEDEIGTSPVVTFARDTVQRWKALMAPLLTDEQMGKGMPSEGSN